MLNTWIDFWIGEVRRNPFVALVILAFVVSTVVNAMTGYRVGNGSLAVAAVLATIAVFTSYAGTMGFSTPGARGWIMLLFVPFGMQIDQLAQWQTYGINFADGQVARNVQADSLKTLQEKLKLYRKERAEIGTVQPVNAIVAKRVLECGKTSKRYPDGNGPKCTNFKALEETARRAVLLDDKISHTVAAIDDRPPVAGGDVKHETAESVFSGAKVVFATSFLGYRENKVEPVTSEQIEFYFLLLLAGSVGVLANLGFWIAGVRFDREVATAAGPADEGGGVPAQLEGPPPTPLLPRGSAQAPRPANDPRPLMHQASMPGAPNQTFNIHAAAPGHQQPLPPRIAAQMNAQQAS